MDLLKVEGLLRNHCKQKGYKTPKFQTVFIEENDYKKLYTVSVDIKGVLNITASGISRRIAQKKAALKALIELKVINTDVVNDLTEEEEINDSKSDVDVKFDDTQQSGDEEVENVNESDEEESDERVVPTDSEMSDNSKNIILLETPPKIVTNIFDRKPDHSLNVEEERTSDESSAHNSNNNKNNYDLLQLNENPICGLIKYCLRTGIALPFYDFTFNEGLFCTHCRIESNGTEYVGFGKSATLRAAKIGASQEVIDQLKIKNIYTEESQTERYQNSNDFSVSSDSNQMFENKLKEYSKVTINMTSTERKIIETKTEIIPIVKQLEDFDDDFKDQNSTLGSMDDNNNPTESQFNSSTDEQQLDCNIIIDNPIGFVEEVSRKNKVKSPKYELLSSSGVQHLPQFAYKCTLELSDGIVVGRGMGNKKKTAKRAAAEDVAKQLLKS